MDTEENYSLSAMIESVRSGLGKNGQKELQCTYFYDEVGSALFEVICALPEYGLARAGERLLQEYSEELVARLQSPVMVVELGSGSGRKARWVLETLSSRQLTIYCPIEISSSALSRCKRELESLESVTVLCFKRDYLDGLQEAVSRRPPGTQILVLFLGSTIGNFDRYSAILFLQEVRRILRAGDALVLATDLVKAESVLLKAYDDPIGVTSAFNLNLLARLNRDLGADFVISRFKHQVLFNRSEQRIEMHLKSLADQTVSIPGAGMTVRLRKNETIWTESSHKYTLDDVLEMGIKTGFRCDAQWIDREWPFAQSLFYAV